MKTRMALSLDSSKVSAHLRTACLAVKQHVWSCPIGGRSGGRPEGRCYMRYIALFVILAGFSVGVRAQDVASITGEVTDKTGGRVPDASVKLTNTRTGAEQAASNGDSA